MYNLIDIFVVEGDSSKELEKKLCKIMMDANDSHHVLKIKYVSPAISSEDNSVIWSALVREFEGPSLES